MSTRASLTLYEEILLLALDDDKGTTEMGGMYVNAMGGAILAELVLVGALVAGKTKKDPVTAVKGVTVDDEILAECLAKVLDEKKPKKAVHWVQKFAGLKDLRNRAARGLVQKRVLAEASDKVLGIFPRTIFPENDPGPEQELRARLKRAVFTSTQDVDARTIVVVAMAQATGMLGKIFDKKKLKERKQRLEKLTSGQVAGAATKEAVEAVQAAVMVAVMVPVITSAAT
ncbi:MAG: GPP34 family phosphoprotein [bacterium]|nr:GPP34 family phosphoprotein [bacterium]